MANDCQLAIVIPAYKSAFFREALESVASQTDRRFRVYIGDDASPEPLAEIVREFSGKLPIQYERFDTNLGKASLVRHWDRSIRMSKEPWVWLFSDDDVMDAACVEKFYSELENTAGQHDLYRFNTVSLNTAKQVSSENPPHPQIETGSDFLLARLRDLRHSTAQELIFSRAAYETAGGFPDFPFAWASDDGFIAKLGARKTIRAIYGPRMNWRMSGQNISTRKSAEITAKKVRASRMFVEWAAKFLEEFPPANEKLTKNEIAALMERWFFWQVIWNHQFLNWSNSLEVESLTSSAWNRWRGYGILKAMKFNCTLAATKALHRLNISQPSGQANA